MARTNVKTSAPATSTFEGGPASHISATLQLRRLVMACMLWEDQFYVDGKDNASIIGDTVKRLIGLGREDVIFKVAVEAREISNLRHVPLFLAAMWAANSSGDIRVSILIERIIKRADEPAELLAIYAKIIGVSPKEVRARIPAQMKKGLAAAFLKFDEYQLGKYDRKGDITMLDAMRLSHPRAVGPNAGARAALAAGTLKSPDTWEVALSGGADKKETFTRLIETGNLGYMALLRNLRNMEAAGVKTSLVRKAILARKNGAEKLLPFRYVAAARHNPWAAGELNTAMIAAVAEMPQFDGETVFLLDHSGSMDSAVSSKSEITRAEAAGALAALWPGQKRVFSFSGSDIVEVPSLQGLPMVDAFIKAQYWGGTSLGAAISKVQAKVGKMHRFVVITDEQSADRVGKGLADRPYMINVGSYQRGVGYGSDWHKIDGWSDGVIKYISAYEADAAN